jgi:ribosomal protein S18 acetylase RimI-like enzyme
MTPHVRVIDWTTDPQYLKSFLPEEQITRLEILQDEPGSSIALVASMSDELCGWALAHVEMRSDLGWIWDADAIRSLTGRNACVEYLDVKEEFRRRGVGSALLFAMESELRRCAKTAASLHCADENGSAKHFYLKAGWHLEKEVTPEWANGRRFGIYLKSLDGLDNQKLQPDTLGGCR